VRYLKNKIKDYRKNKGLTQDDLAKVLGVTRQTIISIESGKYNASLQLAFVMSRFFGVQIEDLFIFED
jgi:putative transcriptional regulator